MGKYGLTHTKKAISTAKIGVIAILQEVAKDGFQFSDFTAPLKSPIFLKHYQETVGRLEDVILECSDLDFMEKVELGKHLYDCGKDISTDLKLAVKAIKGRKNIVDGAVAAS